MPLNTVLWSAGLNGRSTSDTAASISGKLCVASAMFVREERFAARWIVIGVVAPERVGGDQRRILLLERQMVVVAFDPLHGFVELAVILQCGTVFARSFGNPSTDESLSSLSAAF